MTSADLVKGERYKIPNCDNIFVFGGRYGNNILCFTRQDGMRFCGREFIEYKNGEQYLNIEVVK